MNFLSEIMRIILDLLSKAWEIIKKIIIKIYEKFLEINIIEKLIVVCFIPAMVAVIAPVCSYEIFGGTKNINNPIAELMIGIIVLFVITFYHRKKILFYARTIANIYYFIKFLYIHNGPGIIKTQYELSYGFYINIIIPLIFILLSLLSFFFFREEYN